MSVYEIARWAEVFETSESRKLKSLAWIAERTDFTSTGWQQGLDEFGPSGWLQIYGAWMVIVRTAATAKVRGRLCGDKGEPWSPARIARPSGVDTELIAQAFSWAVKVGWLCPVDLSSGDLRENLPESQEKNMPTRPDPTEPNMTGPDQTGRENPSEPGRAEGSKNSKTKSANADRPGSLKLHELAKHSPFLQSLEAIPVQGSGKLWHGTVFSRDRLQPRHIADAPAAFWIEWYQNQLTADSPVLRCANQAEAAFVLASVYAVRRATDASLNGSPRIARWIHWIKNREASQITSADFTRAAGELAKHFGTEIPAAFTKSTIPTTRDAPITLTKVVSTKPRMRTLKDAVKEIESRSNQ